MGCDFPLKAYLTGARHPSGKSVITFNASHSIRSNGYQEIPCGNCIGCKLEKSRQWSVRMMHEARYHPENCFLTLTYNDENVPQDFGLNLRHWQLFMKKLRRSLPQKIRFFACGEYGDLNGRPHFHAVIFGYDPPDKTDFAKSGSGELLARSKTLDRLWGHGSVTTQDVTHKSCAYVARYVTKKIKSGDEFGASRYYRLSPVDGAYHTVRPEFAVMSRRPGIGSAFARDFKSDFYPSGYLVVGGVRQAPPRYYLSRLTEEEQRRLKFQALGRGRSKAQIEKTMERRLARAAVRDARIHKLKRTL